MDLGPVRIPSGDGTELLDRHIRLCTSATVTVGLSLATKQKKTDAELKGLVYSLTPKVKEETVPWYQRSTTLAIFVLAIAAVLTILFW